MQTRMGGGGEGDGKEGGAGACVVLPQHLGAVLYVADEVCSAGHRRIGSELKPLTASCCCCRRRRRSRCCCIALVLLLDGGRLLLHASHRDGLSVTRDGTGDAAGAHVISRVAAATIVKGARVIVSV